MPVRRDQHGAWFFRTTVKSPDGTKQRISGWPGVPGPYQDLGRTQVGAKEAERRAIALVLSGKSIVREATAPKEEPAKVRTIREHAETFVDTYKPGSKPSEKRTKTWILEQRLLPFFGDLTIEALKQTDVDRFAAGELQGRTVKTVNNRLAVLSTLIKYVTGERSKLRFKLAGMTGELSSVAPCDVDKLVAAADARYRVVVLLASEAGLRAGEIRGLQWTDIKEGQATVRRALDNTTNEVIAPKHNRTRTVPLSPRLVAALAELPRIGLWVISRGDGDALGYYAMVEAVGALYGAAGVVKPPKPIHCLRHTFGTVMAKRVPLGVLQKLMGHAEVTTTMRYVDISEDDKRDAIAAVFGAFSGSMASTWQPEPKNRAK